MARREPAYGGGRPGPKANQAKEIVLSCLRPRQSTVAQHTTTNVLLHPGYFGQNSLSPTVESPGIVEQVVDIGFAISYVDKLDIRILLLNGLCC